MNQKFNFNTELNKKRQKNVKPVKRHEEMKYSVSTRIRSIKRKTTTHLLFAGTDPKPGKRPAPNPCSTKENQDQWKVCTPIVVLKRISLLKLLLSVRVTKNLVSSC